MRFAWTLGLGVAETALVFLSDGQPALVSKRFDRRGGAKIHTEDFAQALAIRDKYKSSYEQIGGVIKRNPDETASKNDLMSLLQVVLLNFVIGNCDSHLKNFSLIHDLQDGRPRYRLAPFYDILPVRVFARKDPNQLGLTIDGRANKLSRDHFDRFAIRMGLPLPAIDDFVDRIAGGLDGFYAMLSHFGAPGDLVEDIRTYCLERLATLKVE